MMGYQCSGTIANESAGAITILLPSAHPSCFVVANTTLLVLLCLASLALSSSSSKHNNFFDTMITASYGNVFAVMFIPNPFIATFNSSVVILNCNGLIMMMFSRF